MRTISKDVFYVADVLVPLQIAHNLRSRKRGIHMTGWFHRAAGQVVLATMLASVGLVLLGCERKEKVLDVKTPNKRIEVERSNDTGRVDVNVESPRRKGVEVETPNTKVEVKRPQEGGAPNVDVRTGK